MRSRVRTLAALTALAFLATAHVPCPCAPQAAARPAAAHDCCAPPTGVSAAGHGCCDSSVPDRDAANGAASPEAAPCRVVWLHEPPASSRPIASPRLGVLAAALSPPLVLRI